MGIRTQTRCSSEGETMYLVEVGHRKIAFLHAEDAINFCKAMKVGKQITSTPWNFHGVNFMFDPDFDPERPEISTERVLQATNVEGLGEEEFEYTCDHHIVRDSDVCGISKCYQSITPKRGDELLRKGWRILYGVRMNPDDEPIDIVTCPDCMERIAADEDKAVNQIDDVMIFEARKFQLEVIERKKENS